MFRYEYIVFACNLMMLSHTAAVNAVTQMDTACAATRALTVISGDALGSLEGNPAQNLSLLRYWKNNLSAIEVQIDQRDDDGRYILNGQVDLSNNDELVFATDSIGLKLPEDSDYRSQLQLTEIEIAGLDGSPSGWVYASPGKSREPMPSDPLVSYSAKQDRIETGIYRIGFSAETPFLVDTLQWKLRQNGKWSPDLIDTMKIKHLGRLFGLVSFERSQRDYSSVLTGVKSGPFRIIRRTENRVRVFWQIESPELHIDYVVSPDGFVMDTIIDIPFKPGLFFSDLVTLTTVDWNPSPEVPPIFLQTGDSLTRLRISGVPSENEALFNQSTDNRFHVQTRLGSMSSQLHIPKDVPINSTLYLRDDLDTADPPEQFSGQFGNVGFKTTGWENIDTQVHHLEFTVCFSAG